MKTPTTQRDKRQTNRLLVIIDMQSKFPAALDRRTIAACVREVKAARRRNEPIILLEYESYFSEVAHCHTLPAIRRACKGYSRCYTAIKSNDDGSYEIENAIQHYIRPSLDNWWFREARVCGVNVNACVAFTVDGLMKRYSDLRVTIVADACNGPVYNQKCSYGKVIYRHDNIKVIHRRRIPAEEKEMACA